MNPPGRAGFKTLDYADLQSQKGSRPVNCANHMTAELKQNTFQSKFGVSLVPSSYQNVTQEVLNFGQVNKESEQGQRDNGIEKKRGRGERTSSVFQNRVQPKHRIINFSKIPQNLTSNAQISRPNTSRMDSLSGQFTLRSNYNSGNYQSIPQAHNNTQICSEVDKNGHILIYEKRAESKTSRSSSFYLGKQSSENPTVKMNLPLNNFNKSKESFLAQSNKGSFISVKTHAPVSESYQQKRESKSSNNQEQVYSVRYPEHETQISEKISENRSCNVEEQVSHVPVQSGEFHKSVSNRQEISLNDPRVFDVHNSCKRVRLPERGKPQRKQKAKKLMVRANSQDLRYFKTNSGTQLNSSRFRYKNYETDRIMSQNINFLPNPKIQTQCKPKRKPKSFYLDLLRKENILNFEARSQGASDNAANSFVDYKSQRSFLCNVPSFSHTTSNEANILCPENLSYLRSLNSSNRTIQNYVNATAPRLGSYHTTQQNSYSQNKETYENQKSTSVKNHKHKQQKSGFQLGNNESLGGSNRAVGEAGIRESEDTLGSDKHLNVQGRGTHQSETRPVPPVFPGSNNLTWGQFYKPSNDKNSEIITKTEYSKNQFSRNLNRTLDLEKEKSKPNYQIGRNISPNIAKNSLNFLVIGERSIQNNFVKNGKNMSNLEPRQHKKELVLDTLNGRPGIPNSPETPCFIINPTPNFQLRPKKGDFFKQGESERKKLWEKGDRNFYKSSDPKRSKSRSQSPIECNSRKKIKILEKSETSPIDMKDKLGFCEANLSPKSPRVNIYKEWTQNKNRKSQTDNQIVNVQKEDSRGGNLNNAQRKWGNDKSGSKQTFEFKKSERSGNSIHKKEILARLLTQGASKSNSNNLTQKLGSSHRKQQNRTGKAKYKSFQQETHKLNSKLCKKFINKGFKQRLIRQTDSKTEFSKSFAKKNFHTDFKWRTKKNNFMNKSKFNNKTKNLRLDRSRNPNAVSKQKAPIARFVSRNDLFSASEDGNFENGHDTSNLDRNNYFSVQEPQTSFRAFPKGQNGVQTSFKKSYTNDFTKNRHGGMAEGKKDTSKTSWIRNFGKKGFRSGNAVRTFQRETNSKIPNFKENKPFLDNKNENRNIGRSNSVRNNRSKICRKI